MKRMCFAGVWLLALVVCLLGLDRAMRREDSDLKYSAFYAENQPIDVYFLGTSHVIDGIYPMELWRDYGIVSYNLGNSAETMEATYWTLRLALQKNKPKVAVVDVGYVDRAQSISANLPLSHTYLDSVPLSVEKLRASWSLFPEGSRAEFVFPLAVHHTRWEEFLDGVQKTTDCVPCMRGAELRVGRAEPAPFVRTQETDETDTPGKQALCRIIELCRSEGIEVALIAVPYPAEEIRQRMMNSAQSIADAYGIAFYNLFDVEGLVDFETDCYDAMSHLNPDGAVKVTAWLGEMLSESYDLPDRRGDPAYAHWNEALAEYEALYEREWSAMSLLNRE